MLTRPAMDPVLLSTWMHVRPRTQTHTCLLLMPLVRWYPDDAQVIRSRDPSCTFACSGVRVDAARNYQPASTLSYQIPLYVGSEILQTWDDTLTFHATSFKVIAPLTGLLTNLLKNLVWVNWNTWRNPVLGVGSTFGTIWFTTGAKKQDSLQTILSTKSFRFKEAH